MDFEKKITRIRSELARLARSKKARDFKWTPECPTEWQPTKVIDPRTQEPFTPAGAWEFVADSLDDPSIEVIEKIMDKPSEKKAYVMKITTKHGKIYIKVQFGYGGKIKGRSFH